MTTTAQTAVLEVSGVQWASEKAVVEAVLGRRPGVRSVDANPVAQTATINYDPTQTSVAELAGWVRDCGYHCAGRSVPAHVCDPLIEPTAHHAHTGHTTAASADAAAPPDVAARFSHNGSCPSNPTVRTTSPGRRAGACSPPAAVTSRGSSTQPAAS